MITRRQFMDTLAIGTAGLAITSSAKSYASILGSNDRLNFAVIGLNSRAYAHLSALKANKANARISHVCDVESNILKKYVDNANQMMGETPVGEKDFRKILAMKEIDAITIATPDHWHAPMAILGLEAGKHVYVEKPCSHNPAEGALLVEAQKKYGKLVQMGSQQRSSPHTIEIVNKIHDGLIGRAYFAKTWYSNVRKSIGYGKVVPVPATLDWDLFQGPAPRQEYKDNVQPYNWHWFKTWGTGESLNNGTHEVDVARWALGVGYPNSVTSTAGRYQFKDDWQFYDTMVTSFAYEDAMLSWEGKCCNGMKYFNRDRGVEVMGTTGSVIVDRDGYEIYDLKAQRLQGGWESYELDRSCRPRFHDRRTLCELHRRNSEGRKASPARGTGQCRGHNAPAFEYCVGGKSRVASRYCGRKSARRSCSDEDVGAHVRKGLGTASVVRRGVS
jgi:predicted dehydrogenase